MHHVALRILGCLESLPRADGAAAQCVLAVVVHTELPQALSRFFEATVVAADELEAATAAERSGGGDGTASDAHSGSVHAAANFSNLWAVEVRERLRLSALAIRAAARLVAAATEAGGAAAARLGLLAALRDSCLLEHATRAAVALACAPQDTSKRIRTWEELRDPLLGVLQLATPLTALAAQPATDPELAGWAEALLSGGCLRYAMLWHLVAHVCPADGGPAYGLPRRACMFPTVGLCANILAGGAAATPGAAAPDGGAGRGAEEEEAVEVHLARSGARAAVDVLRCWTALRELGVSGGGSDGSSSGSSSSEARCRLPCSEAALAELCVRLARVANYWWERWQRAAAGPSAAGRESLETGPAANMEEDERSPLAAKPATRSSVARASAPPSDGAAGGAGAWHEAAYAFHPDDCLPLAHWALLCTMAGAPRDAGGCSDVDMRWRFLLRAVGRCAGGGGDGGGDGGGGNAAWQGLWRLLTRTVRNSVSAAAAQADSGGAGEALRSPDLHALLLRPPLPLLELGAGPPLPPPRLSAALSAGYLLALERLLRRCAAADPIAAVGALALHLSRRHRRRLAALLAHGSPQQAAALLWSGAKCLRLCAPHAAMLAAVPLGGPGSSARARSLLLCADLQVVAECGLSWACACEEAAGGPPGPRPSDGLERPAPQQQQQPLQQLRLLSGLALSRWLPALALVAVSGLIGIACRVSAQGYPGVSGGHPGDPWVVTALRLSEAVLSWVPQLVLAHVEAAEAAGAGGPIGATNVPTAAVPVASSDGGDAAGGGSGGGGGDKAATAAAVRHAAGSWLRLLRDMDVTGIVTGHLRLASALRFVQAVAPSPLPASRTSPPRTEGAAGAGPSDAQADAEQDDGRGWEDVLASEASVRGLLAALIAFPDCAAEAVEAAADIGRAGSAADSGGPPVSAGGGPSGSASASLGLTLRGTLERLLGPGCRGHGALLDAACEVVGGGRRPGAAELRALLRGRGGHGLERPAGQRSCEPAGGGEGAASGAADGASGGGGGGVGSGPAGVDADAVDVGAACGSASWGRRLAAALLPLPAPCEAAAALRPRLCANPACTALRGDSDAAVPLQACGRCGGAAAYCGRECQVAHWRAGHREECAGRERG